MAKRREVEGENSADEPVEQGRESEREEWKAESNGW